MKKILSFALALTMMLSLAACGGNAAPETEATQPAVSVEMTAEELDASCRTYVALRTGEMSRTKTLLGCKYSRVEEDEAEYIRVYDMTTPEEIVTYLYENDICVTEIMTDKIGLEEYYIDLMKEGN